MDKVSMSAVLGTADESEDGPPNVKSLGFEVGILSLADLANADEESWSEIDKKLIQFGRVARKKFGNTRILEILSTLKKSGEEFTVVKDEAGIAKSVVYTMDNVSPQSVQETEAALESLLTWLRNGGAKPFRDWLGQESVQEQMSDLFILEYKKDYWKVFDAGERPPDTDEWGCRPENVQKIVALIRREYAHEKVMAGARKTLEEARAKQQFGPEAQGLEELIHGLEESDKRFYEKVRTVFRKGTVTTDGEN